MSVATCALGLPPDPRSAGRARRFVRSYLGDIGWDELGDLTESATLMVSEIVTNVVLHAPTWLEVRVASTRRRLRVDVLDGSPVAPAQRDYVDGAATGHGLSLVAHLAADYGVDVLENGKSVWFTLDADQPADGGEGDGTGASEWPSPAEVGAVLLGDVSGEVFLKGLPVRLWQAARQHHEAALRELYLHHALRADDGTVVGAAARTLALQAAGALDAALDLALSGLGEQAETVTRLDLHLPASTELAAGLVALQQALDEAQRMADEGDLLVLPALPEVVDVRDWCCEQVVAQVNGVAPTPWTALGTPKRRDSRRGPVQGWDARVVTDSDRCVVAGDDRHRLIAVSGPAAQLLGWAVDDLVGRRVTDLVPPDMREAHIAGFTRYQTIGESRVLGRDLKMPVLRADGQSVLCQFRLEKAPAPAGRSVFLVWFDPVTPQ